MQRLVIRHEKLIAYEFSRCMSSFESYNISPDSCKVICITGPTASGKSAVALQLSKYLPIEIVSADSVQIYRHLNIGSNKVTPEEQAIVPHHLIDIANPNDPYSAGDFVRAAAPIIVDIFARGKVPVVVGGCTMWTQWLVHGIPDAPKTDVKLSIDVEKLLAQHRISQTAEGWDNALKLLSSYDEKRAAQLCRNDWYRLRRALEIAVTLSTTTTTPRVESEDSLTGMKLSSELLPAKNDIESATAAAVMLTGVRESPLAELLLQQGKSLDIRCFFIQDPQRERLYRTIDKRCEVMLVTGLLEEVTQLLVDGWFPPPPSPQAQPSQFPSDGTTDTRGGSDSNNSSEKDKDRDRDGSNERELVASKAIGYRQAIDYLCNPHWINDDNEALLSFLKTLCTATRNYAKRQMAWYRGDSAFLWINSIVNTTSTSTESDITNNTFEELIFWFNAPRDVYEQTITKQ
eukprot:gene10541-21980_t